MKWNVKSLLVGIAIGVTLSGTVVSAGGSTIEVYFKNLRMMFDGVEQSPEDKPVFIYEGTTYVPLRFIGESMGKLVQYDANIETIWVGGKRYSQPPAMAIDSEKRYKAIIETTKGTFTIELFAKDAPNTVNNFVALAKDGYYDGIIFHRIIEGFVIQTGDPTGNGTGGPGYEFQDELDNGHEYGPGIVGMANSGPDTNGSQFFIGAGEDSRNLNFNPNYSIFGQIVDGMDVVEAIAATSVTYGPMGDPSYPIEEIKMLKVSIEESS
jgi:cyclophilin family peptidyl-prolyl cis-trans isomerase